MKHTRLHELAKFFSGLIAGDFLYGIWLYTGGFLPLRFWGITFAPHTVMGAVVFDALLFVFLIHYGWFANRRPRTSAEKRFHTLAGIIFTIVAILHLSRILFGWDLVIGAVAFPYWVNALGTIITAFLAYASFNLAARE